MRQIRDSEIILAGRMLGRKPDSFRMAVEQMKQQLPGEYFFDIDGVTANFADHLLDYLHLPKYPITEFLDPRILHNYHRIKDDSNFWLTIPPYPDTILHKVNAYITARPEELVGVTEQWLEDHRELFPEAPVISRPQINKVNVIPKGAFYLDDHAPTIRELRQNGVEAYLRDQSWNRDWETEYRVFSVEEFYRKTSKP